MKKARNPVVLDDAALDRLTKQVHCLFEHDRHYCSNCPEFTTCTTDFKEDLDEL